MASADWPLVSDVFLSARPHDAGEAAAVWRAFKKFAKVTGYGTRPATERDFASIVRSIGNSAAWLRCMLRCNSGWVLSVPHQAAELPFVAGEEKYAYLWDWHTRLRHRHAVPFGHSLALAYFGGVGALIALASVGPATAPADFALEAARRARGELVSARRAGHGAIFLSVRSVIALKPSRAPLPPAMVTRCATPRLLTNEYPPVGHQQQSLFKEFPWHFIQGTAYVMLTAVLNRRGDRGWGTTVTWLSGLSLCVCVRTCFVGCPQDRPPLATESTSQIAPTGPSPPPSRAHTDAHALAPNRITHQIKSH